ncbi:branched-chain amino acid ABC transporter permease [Sphaerisporangium krabiense]|uniref:Branched-chain amino acid transport system permease protein n=1 Tax=Sphaerisporangium krabiense TaxID=763782 RepID=A0A7W9DRB8_9ACTN|nr:branched-chain amino acid ABC transporter permease [Sphaerisporangium krabiense]MBB5628386.1 branched-chain amino acid transport system permease protein [Sphaerisporangium krabiense]GII66874.1 branched-chain amino acid ABC transporter permease [Sphaerisporangium krabiense]
MLNSIIAGLTSGGVYALLGLCVVLTYRLVAVVNFAMAATGAVGAFTMVSLTEAGLNVWPALILGVAAGAALSGLLGAVLVRWFSGHDERTKAAVTVAIYVALMAAGLRIFGNNTSGARNFPRPFDSPAFTVGDVVVPQAVLVSLAFAVLITVGVGLLLSRTGVGLRLQALSERPETAQVVGIPAPRLAMAVWVAIGALTTLVILIVAPRLGGDFSTLGGLIATALAVAMVGAFRSLPLTLLGGILLGCLEGFAAFWEPVQQYRGVVPFLVILVLLWWRSRHEVWDTAHSR